MSSSGTSHARVIWVLFMQVLYLDPKENPGALDFFGVKSEDSPMVVVHAPKSNGKYASGTIDVSKVVSWVADFQAGKVDKVVKSEEIPESQDEPVTVVVGKSFDSVVKSGKNVFIEFYAPWYVASPDMIHVHDHTFDN